MVSHAIDAGKGVFPTTSTRRSQVSGSSVLFVVLVALIVLVFIVTGVYTRR